MSNKTKRILLIVGFTASVIAIGGALYFVFFRAPQTAEEAPQAPEEGEVGVLPGELEGAPETIPGEEEEEPVLAEADEVAQGGPTQTTTLTQNDAENPTVNQEGNANYYDPADGRFYTIDEDGNVERLSDQQFPNAESVEWNNSADKAVIEFPDGSNVVYDFTNEQQVTLPDHWEDFEFSPRNDEILAKSMAIDPNNRWLVTTNSDGSNTKAFQPLGENGDKVQPSWSPNDRVVAFSDTADPIGGGMDRKMILPIGKEGENMQGLVVEGFNFQPLWSPDGKQLVYSTAGQHSNYQPLLWAVDGTPSSMGENRRSLGLNTWAEKCAFADNATMYCAVPTDLQSRAGIRPGGVPTNTEDELYRVNIQSGRTSLVAIPEEDTSINEPSVSPDGTRLFYRNVEGQLETIRLD